MDFTEYSARVVKLVDSGDSKSPAARRAGSSPAPGTIDKAALFFKQCGFFFVGAVACLRAFFGLFPWRLAARRPWFRLSLACWAPLRWVHYRGKRGGAIGNLPCTAQASIFGFKKDSPSDRALPTGVDLQLQHALHKVPGRRRCGDHSADQVSNFFV